MTTTDDIPDAAPAPAPRGAEPLAATGSSYLAVVLALLVIAAGAVGLRDGIVGAGWISGTPWTPAAVDWLVARRPGVWMLPVGVVLVIVGLCCVLAGVMPRRRPTVEVAAKTAMFVDLADTARIASVAAESVAGVVSARSTARRGAVTLRCEVTGPLAPDQRQSIEAAVSSELAPLRATPKVVVRSRTVTGR
ncbi:MAG: hypothetical protein ABW001_13680 [Mycobacterium sp.]